MCPLPNFPDGNIVQRANTAGTSLKEWEELETALRRRKSLGNGALPSLGRGPADKTVGMGQGPLPGSGRCWCRIWMPTSQIPDPQESLLGCRVAHCSRPGRGGGGRGGCVPEPFRREARRWNRRARG